MPSDFDAFKNDPRFATAMLSLMLVCGAHPANPNMPEERLLKARHLLKTLALAAGVDEAEVDRAWVDRAWVDAFCPDEDESPAESPANP